MPAKFEFRLQPLLDWRKRLEEEKQREFSAVRNVLAQHSRELDELIATRVRCLRQLAESVLTRPATDLRVRDAHLRSTDEAIDAARRRRDGAEVEFLRARDALIAASRERRVIEKLKERRRLAFQAESARREEAELDEANARRADEVRERPACRQTESAAP
jgi:flagellar protein FliJ